MKCIWLLFLPFFGLHPASLLEKHRMADDHEFHISKCLIHFNERDQAIQVSMHLFIDDLEEALRRQGADNLYIGTSKEDEKTDALLGKYLQSRFKLRVNGREAPFDFLGKEVAEDMMGIWCYLEVSPVLNLDKLEITNEVLMEVFDDQKNVVNITGPGKEGVLLLQKGRSRGEVAF